MPAAGVPASVPVPLALSEKFTPEGSATPLWAGYWSMKNGITTDKRYSLQCSVAGGEPSQEWTALQAKIVAQVANLVASIRGGKFPVDSRDHECTSRCEFHTICRVSQIRSLEKTLWPDAAGGAAQSDNESTGDALRRGY